MTIGRSSTPLSPPPTKSPPPSVFLPIKSASSSLLRLRRLHVAAGDPMDHPRSVRLTAAAFIVLLQLCSITAPSSAALFAPADNHLLDCGSETSAPTTLDDRRVFVSDDSFLLPSSAAVAAAVAAAAAIPPTDSVSPLYRTARIFRSPSAYEFEIEKKGAHLVRLHFLPFVACAGGVDLSAARFHVVASGYVLLTNFGGFGSREGPILKEFFVPVEAEKLAISFVPVCSESFAFVNAIEVVSLPENLVPDVARLASSGAGEEQSGLSAKAMETLYRINVGGPLVTPYNDTLWRTWVPDAGFVLSPTSSPSRTAHFSSRIMYSKFGASREVAPDSVYNSARLIDSGNVSDPKAELSWAFDVDSGYTYIVRMHFCDIASLVLNELYMNVFINGNLAYQDFDLSDASGQVLASPHYVDFVVDVADSSPLRVSVTGSKLSSPSWISALLNGLEIMKLSNSFGSLGGELPAESVMGSRNSADFLVFLRSVVCGVAFISLIGVVFMLFLKLRAEVARNPWRWTRLPAEDDTGNKLAKGSSMESKMMAHK